MNRVEITGILIERQALRYTPAGVPVVECLVGHRSEQLEAGLARCVECEIQAIGLGDAANWLQAARPGMELRITGFLAAKSRKSRQLRLHINTIEFVEGKQNGQVLQEEG
ncbi:MAG: primosomal replication protein N [Propionivibrio sp.]|nr:primosomal replication protein N [Propionivibrio sp.]